MKKITLLILLSLLIINIACNTGEEILAKFHQNVFKVKDLRTELVNVNKKYFRFYRINTFKYNRTTPAINASLNLKIDLKDKIEVVVQAFKFASNEYRYFPVRFQVNLQKVFEANIVGLKNIRKCGNATSFIFEKDVTYYVCNFVIDVAHLPPLIPNGKYKVEVQLTYLNEELILENFLAEVYTPIDYPKN